ncbi:hypothetical protein RRG08_008908 [Elysia crispata]|uniref:Uncharacterized protein n=1 Tax=Elysia crispata TaxID=231223 RepID=A0AAE1DNA2_9GAST|nr:hypothetical protein RRG08_008908 [Elysia crispata]
MEISATPLTCVLLHYTCEAESSQDLRHTASDLWLPIQPRPALILPSSVVLQIDAYFALFLETMFTQTSIPGEMSCDKMQCAVTLGTHNYTVSYRDSQTEVLMNGLRLEMVVDTRLPG